MSYVQSLYPPEHSQCFGCGPANPAGLHVQTFWDGEVGTCRYTPDPQHMAYPGVVYGGLIACLMDCHGIATAIAAAYDAEGRPMDSEPRINMITGKLNVTYKAPHTLGWRVGAAGLGTRDGPQKGAGDLRVESRGQGHRHR